MDAPAGWYDDPTAPNTRRFWDGERWTDNRQEKGPASDEPSKGVVLLGILAAIFVPIVGLVVGAVLLTKRGSDGIVIVGLSAASLVFWYVVLNSVYG